MNDHILKALDEEIARLRQARNLLGNVGTGNQPQDRRQIVCRVRLWAEAAPQTKR